VTTRAPAPPRVIEPVVVIHRRERDGWSATSPDFVHFAPHADTLPELLQRAEDLVRFTLDRADVRIEHLAAEL
jgi:predicted RNase H-like HicB family nuclease